MTSGTNAITLTWRRNRPNLQDASLVVAILDWVLAEFVRLYHSVTPNEARNMVESIVTRIAPPVEDFDGFLKVLRTDLGASDFMLSSSTRGGGRAPRSPISSRGTPKDAK